MKRYAAPASATNLLHTWAGKLVMWFVVSATATSAAVKLLHHPPVGAPWVVFTPILLACISAGLMLCIMTARAVRSHEPGHDGGSLWGSCPAIEDR